MPMNKAETPMRHIRICMIVALVALPFAGCKKRIAEESSTDASRTPEIAIAASTPPPTAPVPPPIVASPRAHEKAEKKPFTD